MVKKWEILPCWGLEAPPPPNTDPPPKESKIWMSEVKVKNWKVLQDCPEIVQKLSLKLSWKWSLKLSIKLSLILSRNCLWKCLQICHENQDAFLHDYKTTTLRSHEVVLQLHNLKVTLIKIGQKDAGRWSCSKFKMSIQVVKKRQSSKP